MTKRASGNPTYSFAYHRELAHQAQEHLRFASSSVNAPEGEAHSVHIRQMWLRPEGFEHAPHTRSPH